ncbi:MAG: glycosyltransferase family 2 protein [Patescibacteria group bacterium]
MKKTLVSIIIPNYNGKHFLEKCLKSLREQTFSDFEIILIDNGSSDGSIGFIKNHFSEVKIIANKKNTGFAKACNQGIKLAVGKYIILLNNDTMVDKKWIKSLVLTAEHDSSIGMCASKILSEKNVLLVDSVGVNICFNGMSRGRGRLEQDRWQHNKTEEILLPSGCAALYRKEMLDEIGFFDESFFAYCEDTDLGLRGQLAGWKAVLVSDAIVYHYYSGTAGSYSPLKAFLVERNHVLVVLKNFPIWLILLFPFFTFWRYLLQFYGILVRRGSSNEFVQSFSFWRLPLIVFKAYFSILTKLPKILIQRRKIKKQQKISNKKFYLLLKKYHLSIKELVLKS